VPVSDLYIYIYIFFFYTEVLLYYTQFASLKILQCLLQILFSLICTISVDFIIDLYGLDDRRQRFDPRQRIFLLTSVSRPALGPTQPSVQWVPGVLSPGVKSGRGVTLTTHPV
jgi:hypothetical protein